jgi:hypothetical protein
VLGLIAGLIALADVTLNIVNAGANDHNLAVRETGAQSNNMMLRGGDTLASAR